MTNHNLHDDEPRTPEEFRRGLDTNEGLTPVPDDTVLVGQAVPPPGLKPGDVPDELLVLVSLKHPTFGQVKELLTVGLETIAEMVGGITSDLNDGHTVRAVLHLHEVLELINDWTGPVMGALHGYEHTYHERATSLDVDFSDLDGNMSDLMRDLPPLPSQSAGR